VPDVFCRVGLPGKSDNAFTTVLKYHVASLLRPEVGAVMDLAVDENQQVLGDLNVGFVRGTLRLTRANRRVLVNGQLQVAVDAECVRCLTTFQLKLDLQIEELFALSPSADPVYFIDEGGWLNLLQPLREQILLAMPIHLVCRPDCKGLCSQCGQNLNDGPCGCDVDDIDPRLAALKALLQ
jgi:uncharacterized protein